MSDSSGGGGGGAAEEKQRQQQQTAIAAPMKAPQLPQTFERVLVTGGAGFLGSHLCRTLLAEGHSVICLDNLFTSSKHTIRDILNHPNFEFIRHDVTEPIRLVRAANLLAPSVFSLTPSISTMDCSCVYV
jgi:FlaA1/EpsC-like NDP-sugar epimerase